MAKISVFGIGYVGVVSAACLAQDGHEVIAVDVDQGKIDAINAGMSPIVEEGIDDLVRDMVSKGKLRATSDFGRAVHETEMSFVCVGTPSAADGSVGLSYVTSVCEDIGKALREKDVYHSVVIRSTIVPGSTESACIPVLEQTSGKKAGVGFGVGYYPEFLRESTAIADSYDPGLVVFGFMDEPTGQILADLNKDMPCAVNKVDIRTAEMVKYTSNTWRAVKVTFANEIGNIAKSCGIDGQSVMEILCSDKKAAMSPYFMRPGFAFGGSCLPKDVRALRHLASQNDTPAHLLNAVLEANEAQIAKAEAMVEKSGAQKVGFVGISFKPGTDDLRESPLVSLAARLINKGIEVNIYDPFVKEAYDSGTPGAGRGNESVPNLENRLVGDLDELINDAGAVLVGNYYNETVEKLKEAAKTQTVVDLTRLHRDMVSDENYEGICW
ncbi:UDP-glucose/GDP-mannose dehydrogenase family protein [Parasedimentitalea maritima]|uniref:UDP-glucose 6-dehydrogenase n=1 Tax=Parasedimentitalea maritima TaxID=2578117 RepID=A0A5R8ZPU8_9RHOB|nr:UDP-glucose/GDP-mannose dehydrogenase family protein [Zongyanglinia marina]KAE9630080.1 nucleotide sugar dehydrogenase [Zongyanglinia marina]TLP68020.1 UDP-glucose/GDP-mannose dehydrogenase family protein [Zongyanglinia marina]